MNPNGKFITKAPFMLPNRNNWSWQTWRHDEPNKHAAIIAKAKELDARAWDYGQADHGEYGNCNVGFTR